MVDFDKNPSVNVLRQKIKSLLAKSKVAALEVEKSRLEAVDAQLCKEVKVVKCDRAEVVSKVVPYVAMELVHSDEMDMLVGKIVSSAIFNGRCAALKGVVKMKDPFDLAKVKGYRPSYKKQHTKAGNDLNVDVFLFLSEVTADPSVLVKAILSKKPKSLRRPTPTNTTTPAPSDPSQQATPSSAPTPKPVSPPLEPFLELRKFLLLEIRGFASTQLVKFSTVMAKNSKQPGAVSRGTLLVAVGFLVSVSLSSPKDVFARKSARIFPLTELRPLNSMSCSLNSIAHLAILLDFSSLARICLMILSVSTLMGTWKTFGGNTRDLGSILEETGQEYNFTPKKA
ncbi:hypothetical protein Tco_0429260 [Tanacetum coccineum]